MAFYIKEQKRESNISGALDIVSEKQCTSIWLTGHSCHSQRALRVLIRYSGPNGVLHSCKLLLTHASDAKSEVMSHVVVMQGVFVSGKKGPACKRLEKRCNQIIL